MKCRSKNTKFSIKQYTRHNIIDWMGENGNSTELRGFKWRGGRKRETLGIWMWSEVFTHDYENGEKVAIILLDTQRCFDDKSSDRDCTTIFALSTMLSSVQCYNLLQKIREDDLQRLKWFGEYGDLVLKQSNEKAFQKLVVIVRDWPNGFETDYGWNGEKIINETLAGNGEQTPEMCRLREGIRSSFDQITAFLMPHPGMAVAQEDDFTGDLQKIDPEFRKYTKELVPALLAPEKLIVKRINGNNVQARDLLQYLQAFVKIFNGDAMPAPESVLAVSFFFFSIFVISFHCLHFFIIPKKNRQRMKLPIQFCTTTTSTAIVN